MQRIISVYLFLLIVATAICQTDVDVYIAQLKSNDALSVQNAQDYIVRHAILSPESKEEFGKELIKIIEQDTSMIPDTVFAHREKASKYWGPQKQNLAVEVSLSDARTAAIFLVGILKIKAALPALKKQINYVTPGVTEYPCGSIMGPYLNEFPAALAMILIGDDSAPYLRDIIKNHPDRDTRILAYCVFARIQGKGDSVLLAEARKARPSDPPVKYEVGKFKNRKDLQRDNK